MIATVAQKISKFYLCYNARTHGDRMPIITSAKKLPLKANDNGLELGLIDLAGFFDL